MTHYNSHYPDIAAVALERAYKQLGKMSPEQFTDESTQVLLDCISRLEYLNIKYEELDYPTPPPVGKPVHAVSDEKSDAVSDETTAPDPTAAPTPESEGEYMKKEEVRSRLATLQDKHPKLDIAALMAAMGYQKLSAIPASRYQELLDKAEQAAKEIG